MTNTNLNKETLVNEIRTIMNKLTDGNHHRELSELVGIMSTLSSANDNEVLIWANNRLNNFR